MPNAPPKKREDDRVVKSTCTLVTLVACLLGKCPLNKFVQLRKHVCLFVSKNAAYWQNGSLCLTAVSVKGGSLSEFVKKLTIFVVIRNTDY